MIDGPKEPSERLTQYVERREKEYKKVIETMKMHMGNKNQEIEEKIRYQSEYIKKEIKSIDRSIYYIVKSTIFDWKRVQSVQRNCSITSLLFNSDICFRL